MSRIAGVLCFCENYQYADLMKTMMSSLSFSATWSTHVAVRNNVSFGYCSWQSPNISLSQGIMVSMDGFIYNRNSWPSASNDAELFAWLYTQHGFEAALQQINGDFAIALYDSHSETLWLARDRFAIKPLYYVITSDFFAFASRPAALLSLPGVSHKVNRQFVALFAASHYRYFDNQPTKSPYVDIAQLPAAYMLHLKAGQVTTSTYWSLSDLPDFSTSESELANQYRELLIDSVSLRFQASRKPAFTLSGGMDSSSVLASAVSSSGSPQHAFSTVYKDKTYDESVEIQSMLETKVEQWHPLTLDKPDVFSLIQRMVAVHDEPVATATWLSHFLLCEAVAQQKFGGLFGGLGGDELNAGEYEYFFFFFADLKQAGQEVALQRETEKWIEYHDHPIFRKNFEVMKKGLTHLVDLSQPGRCLPDQNRLYRYQATLNPDYFDLTSFQPVMDYPFKSYLKNRTYQDIFRETAPCCLRAEDRQTMAFGLDNFLPFFDHRLVEFMFRVPGTLKIRGGVTKILLREAMRSVLPEETRTRIKKTGWNAPAHVWFSGAGREPLLDMIHSHSFRSRGIYNVAEVERLIEEHEEIVSSGQVKENHMMFLWQLVNLETWLSLIDE